MNHVHAMRSQRQHPGTDHGVLRSFVTTYMEPEAEKLIAEAENVNYVRSYSAALLAAVEA